VIAVKLDEDLPNDLIELLAARNMDVTSVRLQGWTGRPDHQLFADIQPERRWLFTADKGFADIRRYRPGSHHGIVFLRADRESRSAYMALTMLVVDTVDLSANAGALVVVTARGIRIVRDSPPANP
jgi:predicted nuclease of predicted toxin-antitoxin system